MCARVGREKVYLLKINERCVSMRWMVFLCELQGGVLVPLWLSKKDGRYPSCHSKDRVDVSSGLTQLSYKPLDRCVWQRLSINPTS